MNAPSPAPKAATRLAALLAAVGALVLVGRATGLGRALELKTLDWRFQALAEPTRRDPRIVLVAVDQASLDRLEADGVYWPWPRSLYAGLLDYLRRAGAKAVVFDVLFTSPSPYGHSEDEALAKSIESFGPVVLAKEQKRLPVEPLRSAARLIGDAAASPDQDGIFRRVPLRVTDQRQVEPTMAAAAAMAFTGRSLESFTPPLMDGRMLVRFHGKSLTSDPRLKTYDAYPAADLLLSLQALEEKKVPALDPALFKDKLVLVGLTAAGLLDNRPTPISPVFPGTEVIAAAADDLINGDHLRSGPPWSPGLLVLLALLAALAASRRTAGVWTAFASTLGASLLLVGAAAVAFKRGVVLDMAAPQAALWLAFAVLSAYGYAVEGKQKRYIQQAFSFYLSPEVVRQIADRAEALALGGERRDATFYFSDIQGFTSFSEVLPPEKLTQLMNRYLGEMTETVLESGGTLDKYIGDAIMAFWGAPLPHEGHALTACKVALANQERLAGLRAKFDAEGYPPVRNRIGLNTGPAIIGNMGSPKRFSYTAIGDAVNLASRLEGANKAYGTYILVSESTRQGAGEAIEVRELDYVKVKGKNLPIRVYELLGLKGKTDPKRIEKARDFEKGLELYRARKFDEAERHFESHLKAYGDDHACEKYIAHCREDKAVPPPPDWDGSHALTEK